jgi:arylsulfatase A-like enzyme
MSTAAKPNVIYILSDEHRGHAMSHMGDPNVQTPQMDRMAMEGASFETAYANCPICTPSRGTIFSGRHAHCSPIGGFFDNYKTNGPSTAHEFNRAGYHTAYFGKWHMGTVRNQQPEGIAYQSDGMGHASHRTPERHRAGFKDWYGFENLNKHFASLTYHNDDREPTPVVGYETDGLTEMVMDYIDDYTKDEPLYLVLSVTPPHFPLIVEDKWKRIDPAEMQVRDNFVESDENRDALATYYAMTENLDWNIGRLREKLDSNAKFENSMKNRSAFQRFFIGRGTFLSRD